MAEPVSTRARAGVDAPAERRALVASSVLVLLAVVAQAPGRIVPETKLDLVVDPVRYLGRATAAWDPSGGFGRVQNQAAGYLFPMGPFYALGRGLGIPGWVVQRGWIALVLVAGVWGAHRLARAVGVATPAGRLVAAWAYGLAPATLAVAGFQSAGQLPYALAPWVLVPLVSAGDDDRPRRVAARSALAVAAMGGVNGASALAVLPLAAVWFATRAAGPARRRLVAWWGGAVVAATVWWLVPLLVSVRYGIRFTDFTETAAQTTGTESATEVLRGTGNWLGYLHGDGGYWLPGARDLTIAPLAVIGSVLVAAGGLAGLARRDAPGRAWLLPGALLGAALVGIGYRGPLGGSLAGGVQDLLDGPLAPFRNVHKFSAVLRLPLALGLGHLVSTLGPDRRPSAPVEPAARTGEEGRDRLVGRDRTPSWAAGAAPVAAVACVLLAIVPLVPGRATAPGSFDDLPRAWHRAAAWLDAHDDGGRSLLLPGSTFAEYRWGRPLDEPLGALIRSDWAVRDLIPLGGNGSTRLLDGIDRALADDALPPGFTATLRRAGVTHLVVRNDLDLERTGGPGPASVRRLLATADDLRLAASFGDDVVDPGDDRLDPTPGRTDRLRLRQVDVWTVEPAPGPATDPRVAAYPAAGSLVVGGGPEAVLQLPPAVTAGRATVLAVDEPHGEPLAEDDDVVRVATDTARRRDVAFGSIRDNATATLTADQRSPRSGEDPVDLWPGDEPVGLTVARLDGAAALTDSDPIGPLADPEHQPYAAFDGDPATSWVPEEVAVGSWVEVALDGARSIDDVTVQVTSPRGRRIGSITVTTDGGDRTAPVGPDGTATVATAPGATNAVRVTVASIIAGDDLGPVGLAEVGLAGVVVRRPLVAAPTRLDGPASGGGDDADLAAAASFQRSSRDRYDAERTDEEGGLERVVRLDGKTPVVLSGTASARSGPALDRVLHRLAPSAGAVGRTTVRASSRWRDLPAFDGAAALDGDPATAWVSAAEGGAPQLELAWDGPVVVDQLTIEGLDRVGARIGEVAVVVDGERTVRAVPASGRIRFPAVRTDHLVIAFGDRRGSEADRRVGVAELVIPALEGRTTERPDLAASVALPCGQGPALRVDGDVVPTRATATVGDLVAGAPIAWEACAPLDLAAGDHLVEAGPSAGVGVDELLVLPEGGLGPAPRARTVRVARWGREDRRVTIGAGDRAVVATTENFNDGWIATLDGQQLEPLRVDGWRQGWIVPAGSGGDVSLRFAPGRAHRAGLALGAGSLVLLLVAALLRPRRGRPGPRWAAPEERAPGERGALGLAVGVGLAIGGPLVVGLLPLLALRRRGWLPAVGAAAVVAAGAVVLVLPPAEFGTHVGALSAGPQLAAVVALLALGASSVPDRRSRGASASGSGSAPRPDEAPGAEDVDAAGPADAVSPGAGSTPSTRGRSGRRGR